MVWDRLGVLTDEVSDDLDESLDWIRDAGLRHVEIRMVNGKNAMQLNDEQLDRIRLEVERRGLFVSALASPLFKCALDPGRPVAAGDVFGQAEEDVETHFSRLRRAIDIASRLGTNRIRIFSFWREKNPQMYQSEAAAHLRKAANIAREHGMTLLLENEPSCNGGYASEVGALIREAHSEGLKALWDPGNEAYGGRDAFPQGYDYIKDVLGHVHLKDALVAVDGTPQCVPIGDGAVPFVPQLEALIRDGYQGLFTIETHYIPEGGTAMDGTKLTIEGLRKLLKAVEPI
jgi:L-ribulose-5-phosphate 3-epimerase